MLSLLTEPSTWLALLTLTAMEIVLGVDNIVFISVMVSRLLKSTTTPAALACCWRWAFASRCCWCSPGSSG